MASACRYNVPRLIFINKLDRDGADPQRVIDALRKKLAIKTCPLQVPIGLEGRHRGVVDLVRERCVYFEGSSGEQVRIEKCIPTALEPQVKAARAELLETLADLDDEFAEIYLQDGSSNGVSSQDSAPAAAAGGAPAAAAGAAAAAVAPAAAAATLSPQNIDACIRRLTLQHAFVPLLMGAAKANTGVQPLLEAVCRYLPAPCDTIQTALNPDKDEEEVLLSSSPHETLVALAFKIQELPVGQLTYLRLYQGQLRRGDCLLNCTTQKRSAPLKRLLQMHADEAKEIAEATAGDIVAVSGLDCNSGTTFTDGSKRLSLSSMYIPSPVVSLAVKIEKKDQLQRFSKALTRFQREDPTFRATVDEETQETLISGMGELHLQIYLERMAREYRLNVKAGEPKVNYRETPTQKTVFEYTHKKQSGGAGQYGKISGYFEPLNTDVQEIDGDAPIEFRSELEGNDIPPNYVPSIEKGFRESAKKGMLSGHPIINTRFVLQGGKAHDVDSSDLAFRLAAAGALRVFYEEAAPVVLEPIMAVQISVPAEFLAAGLGTVSRRKGNVTNTTRQGETVLLEAEVPLKNMFGYITDLRSCTQGLGEFSMEFARYQPMQSTDQDELCTQYQQQLQAAEKK